MERDVEANIRLDQLMNSDEYQLIKRIYQDYTVFVYCTSQGISTIQYAADCDIEEEEEAEDQEECHVRYTSRDDVLTELKEILNNIPKDNMKKSMEHLQILNCCGLPMVLVGLLRSPDIENKKIAKKCIRLFLISPQTNSCFFLPSSIQNQCATIVLSFCSFFNNTAYDDERKLSRSCRKTLVSILKSTAFSNRPKYFGITRASQLIVDLYSFVQEVTWKLFDSLHSTYSRDFEEYALFSLHFRRVIEEHVKVKGRSLPFNHDDFKEDDPYYLEEIDRFRDLLLSLVLIVKQCLRRWDICIRGAGGDLRSNNGWSYLLSILKELHYTSKLYVNGKEILSTAFREFPQTLSYLILHSNRGDDHLWLLKCDSAIDIESRRNLIVAMFPEVRHDSGKLHKMVIDRPILLTQSYERIAHVKARSLHNGLFVEFKDGVATGHGVLREWLLLVCQALFSPENPFLGMPGGPSKIFPSPAKVTDQQLKVFGFCGRVIALALMHKVQVGIAFDRVFFLQLAKEKISLEDIRCADPVIYRSCKRILEMDDDFVDSDAMMLTFDWEIEDSGSRETVELCPGGSNIVVNSKNREHYVDLLIQHLFVKSISTKVACFARGFAQILCKQRPGKNFFQSIELKDLDCVLLGSNLPISVKDWKAHTMYEGYTEADDQIHWFWKVVEGMSMEQQRELLFFWTSVKYLPVNGFSGLPYGPYPLTIYKTSGSDDCLPSSHTCFCRLAFPQHRLSYICQYVGFGFGFQ
ncbi:hypothetical protein MKW98_028823 [Papaver atlanticum]|uniref:HECT-type E3 ubiquitin transferase n=1 Tax=Papaver atlanticum TaxID=357466 RepID=A0AAD4X811_9MAGN|nr:hypothetical protein MKW98_028823 [Papaver atlanticum]